MKIQESAENYLETIYITLCPKGQEIAERMYERHVFLSRWLTKLGVDPDVAVEDACRIEHVISAESFAAIKRHVSGHGG